MDVDTPRFGSVNQQQQSQQQQQPSSSQQYQNNINVTPIQQRQQSLSQTQSQSQSQQPINYPTTELPLEREQSELSSKVHDFRMGCLDLLWSNQCHNLIPHSGKVVVFDSHLCVKDAFEGMLAHDINCAPVWDSAKRKYVGMLSVSDFIDILIASYYNDNQQINNNTNHNSNKSTHHHLTGSTSMQTLPHSNIHNTTQQQQQRPSQQHITPTTSPKQHTSIPTSQSLHSNMHHHRHNTTTSLNQIPHQRICDWAAIKKDRGTSINRLLCVTPEATLHDAVRMLLQYRVHRLCVVQLALADTVLRILTNHGILRFVRNNCRSLQQSNVTIRDLGIGVFKQLLTVTYDTKLITALELLYNYKISSIPIVDNRGVPIDVYSRSDVRFLAMDANYNLDITLGETLTRHRQGRILPICSRDDTLYTVSGLLVSSMKHSLICVRDDGSIEGVVSLTDIFSFILDSSAPRAESRIAALKADLQQTLDNSNNSNNTLDEQQYNITDELLLHKPRFDELGASYNESENLDAVVEQYDDNMND